MTPSAFSAELLHSQQDVHPSQRHLFLCNFMSRSSNQSRSLSGSPALQLIDWPSDLFHLQTCSSAPWPIPATCLSTGRPYFMPFRESVTHWPLLSEPHHPTMGFFTHLAVCLSRCNVWTWVQGYCGRQCGKPCWSWGKCHLLLSGMSTDPNHCQHSGRSSSCCTWCPLQLSVVDEVWLS